MKTFVWKKSLLFVTVLLLLAVLAVPVFAQESQVLGLPMEAPKMIPDRSVPVRGANSLSSYVDMDALKEHLVSQMAKCASSIDISQFEIPYTEALATELRNTIWYDLPEAFHCYSIGVYMSDIITTISVSYRSFADTEEEYTACHEAFTAGANALLKGIEGNKALTDVEKALLLHDRLALWTEYSYADLLAGTLDDTVYTAYGALGNQSAVCQGYAMAYMYLLDRVGIECDYCSSDKLDHGWNIVYIDGKSYHVDVTWDDPVWDVTGRVLHDNFLRSTSGIISTGHNATDYIQTPSDTTYDQYYWQNSNTAFQLIEDKLYYIDTNAEMIFCVEGTEHREVWSVAGKWTLEGGAYFSRQAKLSSIGNQLLYSAPSAIYLLDPEAETAQIIFEPDLSVGAYFSIYGFKYEGGNLICDLYGSPNFEANSKDYQVRQPYSLPAAFTYTVTFQNWDGTVLTTETYAKGDTVQLPPDPTRPDGVNYTYRFSGWTPEVTVVTGDAVYTATYERILKKSYTITFVNWDGTVLSEKKYKEGSTLQLPPDPVRPDSGGYTYLFAGWTPSVNTTVTADAVYTATYTQIANTDYTITFKNWDDTVISTKTYRAGDTVQLPPDPTRPDGVNYTYRFSGWTPEVTVVTGDAVYTATYERILKKSYTITFVNWDGTVLLEKKYKEGSTVQLPPDPVRPDDGAYTYTFAGWTPEVTVVTEAATYWATYTQTPVILQAGWVQENGTWYYYENGTKLTNQWLQYYGSWYWLDSNGAMASNQWLYQYGTWYWFNEGGAMASNQWLCQYGTWYWFQASGAMAANQWILYGNDWYWLEAGGQMAVSCWKKDSVGWVYLGASGAMLRNSWCMDGQGWCYVGANGYAVTNCWKQDSIGWIYLNSNGSMTKSQWLYDGGYWYYLDANGYMLSNTSLTQYGVTYYFNASGICTNP